MSMHDILFYSLLLIGSIIGIAIGAYTALERAHKKIAKEPNPYFSPPATSPSAKGTDEEKEKKPSRFRQWKEKRAQKKENKLEAKMGRETETYQSLKDRVRARDNIASLNDSECAFDHTSTNETIEAKRQASNLSYEYIKRKKGKGKK